MAGHTGGVTDQVITYNGFNAITADHDIRPENVALRIRHLRVLVCLGEGLDLCGGLKRDQRIVLYSVQNGTVNVSPVNHRIGPLKRSRNCSPVWTRKTSVLSTASIIMM